MNVLGVLLGVALLATAIYDLVVTTLAPSSGAGPLARRLGSGMWRLAHVGRPPPTSSRLRFIGTSVLGATLTTWLVLLVAGWWLVLLGADLQTQSGTAATAGQRLAFAMTTVSSLGPGYLVPGDTAARLAVAVASITGLGLLTLGVTYTLPVVTAVTDRRTESLRISSMGVSAWRIAEHLRSSGSAAQRLLSLADAVQQLAQRHLAYPILHFFHEEVRRAAFAPSLAALDEALNLRERQGDGLDPLAVASFRLAVDELLDVTEHHLGPHLPDDVPPAPHGEVPEGSGERRRRLAAFVADAGWSWSEHVHGDDTG